MSDEIPSDFTRALKLAVFQRDAQGRLQVVGRPPEWMFRLWPQVPQAGGVMRPDTSPFLENFLVDAATCWQVPERRISSGPWVESDAGGHEYSLQATAFTAAGRAALLIEEIGPALAERTSVLQRAHEAALAYEKLQRAEESLAEQKRLLERRVKERTVELSQANAAMREEIAVRRRYAKRLQSVGEIDKAILAAQSPEAIAEAALRRLHPLLPCEHASVVELDADSRRATILASMDHGRYAVAELRELSFEQLEQVQALKSGKRHRINDLPNLFGAGARTWPLIIDVPLIADETLVGVLNLATSSPDSFMQEHEEIAEELGTHLAMAIRQARLFAQVSAGRQRLRDLSQQLVEVQEAERRFLARELHDEIGQVVTGAKMVLDLGLREPAQAMRPRVEEALIMLDELMERVRRLSLDLRPQMLDDLGLLIALEWHFQRYFKQTNIRVEFKHTPLSERLPARIETALFRIAQEALTNVARHSGATEATVRLWSNPERAGLQVEDHGTGFDKEQTLTSRGSTGLAGMRERAELLGGEFTLESSRCSGTRVTVELPLAVVAETPTRRIGQAI